MASNKPKDLDPKAKGAQVKGGLGPPREISTNDQRRKFLRGVRNKVDRLWRNTTG